MYNAVDTKPKVNTVFEPGDGYVHENSSTREDDVEMFEQAAQRNFVARRGRNNRILF